MTIQRDKQPDYPQPTYRCRNCNDNRWRIVLIPAQDAAVWCCVGCGYDAPKPLDTPLCDWLTTSNRPCRRRSQRGTTRCAVHRQAAPDDAPGYR